jgi:hypothetical protein
MPRRNSDSEAMILWAVAAASPDTIRLEGMYRKLKTPSGTVNRYRNPASLAIIRGDVSEVFMD